MYFFQEVGELVNKIFSFIENSANSDLVAQLAIIFSITLTITVLIKGFVVLAGKSQDPIRELLWDMTLKVIIITFVLNIGGWLDLVTNAMEGLHEWAGGGVSLYAELDRLLEATVNLENAVSEIGNMVSSFFYGLIIYLGFLIGALPALFIVITTTFTLKILIMLAPFIFFTTLYGWLKNMFTQWLSLFFANILTVLILGLILNSIINTFRDYQNFLKEQISQIDPFLTSIQVLIIGLLLYILVNIGKGIAEKIATVSMEGIMASGFGDAYRNSRKMIKSFKSK